MSGAQRRVFLDGFNLALAQGTGVATYARNLSHAIHSLGAQVGVLYGKRAGPSRDPLGREVGFFDAGESKLPQWLADLLRAVALIPKPFGFKAWEVPISGAVITSGMPYSDEVWNVGDMFGLAQVRFEIVGRMLQVRLPGPPPDIMHWTYPFPVHLVGAKNIYTLHDLVPMRLPATTLDNKRRYLRIARAIARDADHIVTVSEHSRRDIIELLGVSPDRVTNTYQAVELPQALRDKPMEQVRADIAGSFGLTADNYFLFFGAIEPKKNIGRLIEAYLASGVSGPLVIVGKKAWKSEGEMKLLFEDHIRYLQTEGPNTYTRNRVMHLEYAPFPLLVSLIRGARAVLFPSLYEGFGLPVLEAMLLGAPVMTTNTSSLPELVGDAAMTVDPYDVAAISQAIRALDADAGLRARLSAMGPGQAALFSPEKYQRRLGAVYDRVWK
jgi:glycosyltransferase involved in cell wall biosynthesis